MYTPQLHSLILGLHIMINLIYNEEIWTRLFHARTQATISLKSLNFNSRYKISQGIAVKKNFNDLNIELDSTKPTVKLVEAILYWLIDILYILVCSATKHTNRMTRWQAHNMYAHTKTQTHACTAKRLDMNSL